MLDGEPGPVFDRVLAGFRAREDGPAFLEDGSLVYLAVRDDTLYRIRHLPR